MFQQISATPKKVSGTNWPTCMTARYTYVENLEDGQKEGRSVLPDGHFASYATVCTRSAFQENDALKKFNRPVLDVANLSQPQGRLPKSFMSISQQTCAWITLWRLLQSLRGPFQPPI